MSEDVFPEEWSLITPRLVLRRPVASDAAALAALAEDRVIAVNSATIPHPYRAADAEAWIRRAWATGPHGWVVMSRESGGGVIGVCGAGPLGEGRHAELGYWIGAAYRGRGLATEAARAVVDAAFGHFGAEALLGRTRVGNEASRRVLEHCGFRRTGTGMVHSVGAGGAIPVDTFLLERRDWESLKAWRSPELVGRTHAPVGTTSRTPQ